MKKVTLILSALALVLGLSQCKKQEEPVANGQKQHIVLTATNGNDGSKVAASFASAALNLTWEGTETITVSGGATGELDFKEGEGTSATFEGDIKKGEGDVVFTIGSAPSSYANQTGTADGCAAWIKGNNHFVGTSQWQDDGNYNVTMELQYAVLKLDVSALGTSGEMTIAANGATVASVTNVSGIASAVFVAVPADGSTTAYTITCNGKTATKTWKLEKNVFYTKAGAEGAGTGEAIVIKHEFSVGSGKTVEFARGNLYWDGSAFRFEANQWSFASTWNASHVSHFYWSKDAAEAKKKDFSYEQLMSTEDVFFTNATETTANPDFQVNGEAAGTWRTLSKAEWDYLLYRRTGASSLREWKDFGNNVKGLVILPDGTDASVISISSTEALATYGAVFLPAAGYRNGTGVGDVGSKGYYWSGTPFKEDYAYRILFDSDFVGNGRRENGYAVRLVR